MSLIRVRRGKESERGSIVPKLGEPLFTTDSKRLYVGDGTSAGGVPVGTGEAGQGVPAGGTTGQALVKKSNVSYDTEWVDPEAGGVESVNSQTGVVVLDADDISDTDKTHKFTTAEDISKLAGIEANADVTDTANVDAAGATMNTDTSLAGNGYFLDEDNMASDDATKVPSQQSVKAYVDSAVVDGILPIQTDKVNNRVGINKVPEQGALDVDGDIYSNGLEVATYNEDGKIPSDKVDFKTRTVLYSGNGLFDTTIPLSESWRNFDQIIILASQNQTGLTARASSVVIDVPTWIELNGTTTTYVQILANTGGSTALSYKVDVNLSGNGGMTINSTAIASTPYYIRSVVGLKFLGG